MLVVENVFFTYTKEQNPQNYSLQNIAFRCAPRSFTGIAGPNGSGKTTLLKIIQALLRPQQGDVLLSGRSVFKMKRYELARSVAIVCQRANINFEFTSFQMVLLGRTPHLGFLKWESREDKEIAEAAMRQTNTLQFASRPVGELSAGEYQRVCIATALAAVPSILLLDEPASFLDLKETMRLSNLLHELAESGLTILCSSHDIAFLRDHSTQALLLNAGSQFSFGNPDDLFSHEHLIAAFELNELPLRRRKIV